LHLLARWIYFFVIIMIIEVMVDLQGVAGTWAMALVSELILPFTIFYGVLVERAVTGFRAVRPRYCSIYDIGFWRIERLFKNTAQAHIVLGGTPFISAILRLLGVRVGRRLFDDGCSLAEKNLVTIGDNVTLNAGSHLQCHSQEDYAFKNDHITVGSGCTIGVGALVHYGVTMGDGAVLGPDSFLMKGEEVPAHAYWGGNPAQEMRDNLSILPVRHDNNVGAALVGVR